MFNEIQYSKQAIKFLNKQPLRIRQLIVQAIKQIPEGDIVKLQGRDGYRLRVGSYRVISTMTAMSFSSTKSVIVEMSTREVKTN